jgi:methionine biosynthesis protein MetW
MKESIPESRPDFQFIYDIVLSGTRVLDLGCGNGDLLFFLKTKKVKGQGLEKDEEKIYKCIERGVIVHHGDLDSGLDHHLNKSFDYVILNQTIQETRNPGNVLKESLRIGKKVIVVFPNFGYWKIRMIVLRYGTTPVTDLLPYHWYNTPNLHFLSIKDFEMYCNLNNFKIEKTAFFSKSKIITWKPNFFANLALYVIEEPSSKNNNPTK